MEDFDFTDRISDKRYVKTLRTMHTLLEPETYFEIGTLRGETLALSKCATVAVDPFFQISSNIWEGKPACHLYQTTSDDFFQKNDPIEILGGPIEMAFLDGMHLFEYLLRDFINTEAYCNENSVIALHDCLPPSLYCSSRKQHDPRIKSGPTPQLWAGDVWKVVSILKKYRPDLDIRVTNCKPTGLVVITSLDPGSSVLRDEYRNIVREYTEPDVNRKSLLAYWDSLDVIDHDAFNDQQTMMGAYWL